VQPRSIISRARRLAVEAPAGRRGAVGADKCELRKNTKLHKQKRIEIQAIQTDVLYNAVETQPLQNRELADALRHSAS
jgi:hypothetical protein